MKITFKGFLGLAQLCLKNYWFLMSWLVFCFFVFRCDFNFYQRAPQYFYLRQILGVGVCISRGTAAVINVGIVFLAVPMGKRIISLVRGLIPLKITLLASSLVPPGKTIHLIVAWTILIASVCHSLSHIVNVINYSRHYLADVPEINMASFKGQSVLVLIFTSVPGITGVVMLVILLFLAVTSLKCVRRDCYETFYYCHHCFVILIVLLLLHPLSGVLKGVGNIDSHPPGCVNKLNFTGNVKGVNIPHYQLVQADEKDKLNFAGLKKRDMRQFSSQEVGEIEEEDFTKVYPKSEDLYRSLDINEETITTVDQSSLEKSSSVLQNVLNGNFRSSVNNNKTYFTKSKSISDLLETSTEKSNFGVEFKSTSSIPNKVERESSFYVDNSTETFPELRATTTLVPDTRETKTHSKLQFKNNENSFYPVISNISLSKIHFNSRGKHLNNIKNISVALGLNKLLGKVDGSTMYFLAFKVEPANHSALNSQSPQFSDSSKSKNLHQLNKSKNLSIYSNLNYSEPPNTDSVLIPNPEIKNSTNTKISSLNTQLNGINNSTSSIIIDDKLHIRPNYRPFTRERHMENASRIYCQKPPAFFSIQSESWKWILILSLYLLIDFAIKRVRGMEEVEVLLVKDLPAHTFELTLKKSGFKCNPGQYVLLRCSAVSRYEWHPFTVAKCPADESSPLVLLLRTKGNWCRKLQRAFSNRNLKYVCEFPFIFGMLPLDSKSLDCKPCDHSDIPGSPSKCLSSGANNCDKCLNGCCNKNISSQSSESPRLSSEHCTKCSNSERLRNEYCSFSCWPKFQRNESTRSTAPLTNSQNTPKNINNKKCIKFSQCKNDGDEIKDIVETSNSKDIDTNICTDSINNEKGAQKNTLESERIGDSSSSNETVVIIENENIRNSNPSICCPKYISCQDVLAKTSKSKAISHNAVESQKSIKLHFDGPYNSPNEYMISYPVVIAIAGGIGITPLLASLSYLMKTCEPKPRHFHIVWVFRELEMPFPFLQFFQSALDKFWVENQEDRLELGFYCTQASSDLEAQLNLAPKYYKDLAPFLRARLKFGRPNWEELFKVWKEYYQGSEVGVFCCGPKSLNKQISRFCLRAVGEGLRFSYHHESFS